MEPSVGGGALAMIRLTNTSRPQWRDRASPLLNKPVVKRNRLGRKSWGWGREGEKKRWCQGDIKRKSKIQKYWKILNSSLCWQLTCSNCFMVNISLVNSSIRSCPIVLPNTLKRRQNSTCKHTFSSFTYAFVFFFLFYTNTHLLDCLLDECFRQGDIFPKEQRGGDLEEQAGTRSRQRRALNQPQHHL